MLIKDITAVVVYDLGIDLSKRQKEVLSYLLFDDRGNRHIATKMGISENTLRGHIEKIYNKLGVNNRQQLKSKLEGVQ